MNSCHRIYVTATLIGWMCLTFTQSASAGVTCLACSYTFAGEDGQVTIKCVNDVYNFTNTFSVMCTKACVTRVVYTTGYKRINSISRGCAYTETNVGCDAPENINPTCILTCSTDRCNDQNDHFWNGSGNENSSPGLSAPVLYLAFSLICLFLVSSAHVPSMVYFRHLSGRGGPSQVPPSTSE